ncbi:copper homeostasis membrane protein CopD [Brevundimonas bacteroides]|uniref:copper homeostasis membrane protein CopD n=1 Tax=Brevundimonas bacteroides TaxID=74311 RepID=UPI00068CF0F4|nr:copper homeostasis membrane protein CopD [Brevundimonas bacteroides]
MSIDLTVVGLRWLQFAAAVVAMGLPLFRMYAPTASGHAVQIRTAVIAGLSLALGAIGGLLAQTAMMAGGWAAALDANAVGYVVQSTSLGMAHVARAGLAVAAVSLLLAASRRKTLTVVAVVAFAGAAASFAWSGHGASSEGPAGVIHLVADIVHVLAAAVWVGALAGFCLMFGRRDEQDVEGAARSLAGFGTVGTVAVLTLALSGMVNTAFLVGVEGSASLAASVWGQLLLAKIGFFVLMIWLASHNRYTLTPALERAVRDGGDPADPLRSLRVSIGLELAAGIALLGVVAAMGVQMPPASM